MPSKEEQRLAEVEDIFKTVKILNRNSIIARRMQTAYQQYRQELDRLSEAADFDFCLLPHLSNPMMQFVAYDRQLYFCNQYNPHLPPTQVFTSKNLKILLLSYVRSLPKNYDYDVLFERLFTCVKLCGWSANIENTNRNNFLLLRDIFLLAVAQYQMHKLLILLLYNPTGAFGVTPEKTLYWKHLLTPVSLLSFQSFFPQHKFTSDERSSIRKMLGYLKQWLLELQPAVAAHEYRKKHKLQVQASKAKKIPLPLEGYESTTPPIDFLYDITGGDMNLLFQYAKLFAAVGFPTRSPEKLFLLSGTQEDIDVLHLCLYYLFNFPDLHMYTISNFCNPKNLDQRIHDCFFRIPYSYLFLEEGPSTGKLSQLKLNQILFLKRAVNAVIINSSDAISGKVYWRNRTPIIIYSNHDHFNTALCNHMKVEHIHIPHIVEPEKDSNQEWTLSYLITYGLWLSCGAKLNELSTRRDIRQKRDISVFDLFLARACQYQQGSRVHCQELYQGYTDLCKNLDQIPMSSREFFNYFKNSGSYLWKRTRTKADDYKTYIVNLSYLGTDTLDLQQGVHDKESFAYALSLIAAEVDNSIQTDATTTDCND